MGEAARGRLMQQLEPGAMLSVSLGEQDSTVTLRFDNPRGAQKISITPPAPTEPKESASGGFMPKKLGIGLVSLKVEAAAPAS